MADVLDRGEAGGSGTWVFRLFLRLAIGDQPKVATLSDLGEAFSDGRRGILPPLVCGLDGVHVGIRADAS